MTKQKYPDTKITFLKTCGLSKIRQNKFSSDFNKYLHKHIRNSDLDWPKHKTIKCVMRYMVIPSKNSAESVPIIIRDQDEVRCGIIHIFGWKWKSIW